jgi:hypothetical protein
MAFAVRCIPGCGYLNAPGALDRSRQPSTSGPEPRSIRNLLRASQKVQSAEAGAEEGLTMRSTLVAIVMFSLAFPAVAQRNPVVPDAATAVAIARAVLLPVYGQETVSREEPLTATLDGDFWLVRGTLHCPPDRVPCVGGTAVVQIDRRDGRIVGIDHR